MSSKTDKCRERVWEKEGEKFKSGQLKSGSGRIVTKVDQFKAIASSETRKICGSSAMKPKNAIKKTTTKTKRPKK